MLLENVIGILEENRGNTVTGGELARALNVSRTSIWKTITALKKCGHDIETLPNSGYKLLNESDGLILSSIKNNLKTNIFGRDMEVLSSIESTNSYLKAKDVKTLSEGYAVIADEQTGGRGRRDRPFYSPRGNGVYLSCLLKPELPASKTPFITMCAAVAVSDALEEICGINSGIKWVNDIFVNGKKLCGILTEASLSAEMQYIDYAALGIGVNTCGVSPEVSDIATSVFDETGLRGVRNRLIAGILNHFERLYLGLVVHANTQEILKVYEKRLFIIGSRVAVTCKGEDYEAAAVGINETGALIVKRQNGEIAIVDSGEIKLVRE